MMQRPFYNDQDIRKRQIDTLKIFNEHVIELKENSEYRIDFTADGQNISLTVVLTADFPNEKPTIFVNPPLPHPWIGENSNQVVGAPGLVNYTQHSDLGRVVQAIVREIQKWLPLMKDEKIESPQYQYIQSSMFPELNELTVEDLQEVLENTDLQDKIIESNPQLSELELETEDVMNRIEQIAQENISQQQTLEDLKTDVINRISTIVQMKMNYEELNRRHQKLSEMYDPYRIRDELKSAALKADEDAEVIAERFLLGEIPVEMFVTKFAERRALGQARRAREERLAHQLTQLDKATT